MHIKTIGSRAEVFHGTALHTSGGLYKDDLRKNKWGKIVSVHASDAAKRNKNLGDYQRKKGSKGFYLVEKK